MRQQENYKRKHRYNLPVKGIIYCLTAAKQINAIYKINIIHQRSSTGMVSFKKFVLLSMVRQYAY